MSILAGITSLLGGSGASSIASGIVNSVNMFGNLASNILTNRTNKKINQATNAMNYNLWLQDSEYQRKMWELENEYNLPENVRKRYEDAGINPALAMAGSGVVGQASTMNASHPSPAQPYSSIPLFAGVDTSGMLSSAAALAKSQAEIRLINSEASLNESKAKYADEMNEQQLNDILSVINARDVDSKYKKWQHDSGKQLFDATFAAQVNKTLEESNQATEMTYAMQLDNTLREKNIYWIDQEKQATIAKIQAETRRAIAEAALAGAMREKTIEETQVAIRQAALLGEQKTTEILRQTGIRNANTLAEQIMPYEIQRACDEAYKVHKESRIGFIYFGKVLDTLGTIGGIAAAGYASGAAMTRAMKPGAISPTKLGGWKPSYEYNQGLSGQYGF